ncbi:ComEC/Rec2 family competence protein [Aurantimonas sp. HBX-1]|uniref:ComEC/Rec2 family competence protein n=1 Tax=Aurantimonas sp. HBX-1 TaxID=2906072 RepID=UPI001F43805F|nr:ComEC/Rec2 family competence protein [Aurantimonas sp. HBX-1]UIJ73759.1 ComEC family competence protein [Aurantimonas sp. HBX-1]
MPIALIGGAGMVHGLGWRPPPLLCFSTSAVLLLIAWHIASRPLRRGVLLVVGVAMAGAGLSVADISRTATTVFSGEATVRIVGTVVARERDDRGRYRYMIDVRATDRPVLSRPPERVRILVGSRHRPIAPGETYAGLVRLRPPSGPAYPGSHDFAFQPFFDGLGAYGFSLGAPDGVVGAAPPEPEPGVIERVRTQLALVRLAMTERIQDTIGGPAGAIAAALITGERAAIPEDAEEWLRSTGLAHVLSISGLHMAIVAGFALVLVRSLLALFPSIALRLPTRKIAAVAALAVATFYLGISGANVATQRAYVMLAVMLVAVLFDRPALTLRNLSIAAIVVVALSPHSVMTASFQMSFAATAALVGGYAALSAWQRQRASAAAAPGRGIGRTVLIALAAILATSLFAGTATAPYSAYHFHRMALFGFVANLLTMPLFSFWIMPLALIGTLLMPFGLDAWFLQLMGAGVALVLEIAHWVHDRLPDSGVGLMTETGLLLLTLAILAGSFLASGLRWLALPLAALGLALFPDRSPRPELLIFEDGKEIATLAEAGDLAFLAPKPNDFVAEQWERAFTPDRPPGSGDRASLPADCADGFCRFVTRGGLKVAWTDDYEKTGQACDEADVAIVARAIRLTGCRSGAVLVTLRTLRRTGSLAVATDPETGRPVVARAIPEPFVEWNRHRGAPWPEFWRKPATDAAVTAASAEESTTQVPSGAAMAMPVPAAATTGTASATAITTPRLEPAIPASDPTADLGDAASVPN